MRALPFLLQGIDIKFIFRHTSKANSLFFCGEQEKLAFWVCLGTFKCVPWSSLEFFWVPQNSLELPGFPSGPPSFQQKYLHTARPVFSTFRGPWARLAILKSYCYHHFSKLFGKKISSSSVKKYLNDFLETLYLGKYWPEKYGYSPNKC